MSQPIDNIYFYQFSTGDSFDINGTYYSTECIDQTFWKQINEEFKRKKKELYLAIPLREAYGRMVLDNTTEEFKAHSTYYQTFNPEKVMIDKYNMVQVDIQDEFWRSD